MPKITKLEVQKKNKDRFNVYLDGEYSFPVSFNVFADFGLRSGLDLSQKEIEEIQKAENFDKVFNKILNFITYQPRTRSETERKLGKILFELEADWLKGQIMEKVDSLKLLDDDQFAKNYIENKKASRTKVYTFLAKRGINREIIEKYLGENKELEIEAARSDYNKKSRSGKDPRKIREYLMRKGYSSSTIKAVFDTIPEVL